MNAVPTPAQLNELDDEALAQLAAAWRARAGQGDRRAFGLAHTFEVEQRRRLRESQLQALPPLPPPPRPWWKFWQASDSSRNTP